MLSVILESALLAASCSLDAFTASFAYGSRNIKIPFLSNQIINLVCSTFLGVSLLFGAYIRRFLSGRLTVAICFSLLFIIGLSKLLDSATKTIIRKHNRLNGENLNKEFKFSLFNFSFILNLYANPEDADMNSDRMISPAEAAALAVSLSLDGIAIGFGAALGNINVPAVIFASLVTDMIAIFMGCRLGHKAARTLPFNASWLSGFILIGLAVSKLFA